MTNLVLSYFLICLSFIICFSLTLYFFRKNNKLIKSNKEDCKLFIETLTTVWIDLMIKDEKIKKLENKNEELKKQTKELLNENRVLFNKNQKLENKLKEKKEILEKKYKLIYYYKNKYGEKSINKWR